MTRAPLYALAAAAIGAAVAAAGTPEDLYFSPDGGAARALTQAIADARETVDVEMYYFTNPDLARALTEAAARGVRCRLVLDEGQYGLATSPAPALVTAGVEVRYEHGPGLLHAKLALFDGGRAAVGSYNWTRRAEEANVEILMFVDDPEYVTAFRQHFAAVWATATVRPAPRADAGPTPDAAPVRGDAYVASANSTRFHYANCIYAAKIKYEYRVTYATREEALAAGKKPCYYCNP